MSTVGCEQCGREAGFHGQDCPAREVFKPGIVDVSAHDAALASLRATLIAAKGQAISVASHKANYWASSLLLAVERAEFEAKHYEEAEAKRRADEATS